MAQLYYRYSTMNAGKSIEVIKVAHNYEERGKRVLALVPGVDDRYGKGKMVGNHSFILENDEFSGEKGLFCACYQQFELVRLLQDELNLFDFEVLESENLNSKANVFIKDSDIKK